MGILGGAVINKLDQLAVLSPVAIEILNIVDKPKVNIKEISDLILLDQVLYAHVMKYTRSAAFALRRNPNTVDEAINYLGLYNLRDLIFFIASKNIFSCPENWQQNVLRAFLAKKLALKMNLEPNLVSNVYIAALMYDIGAQFLERRYRNEYQFIDFEEDLYKRLQLEKHKFGINSVELSYELLSDCNLPINILNIIKNQALNWQEEDYHLFNSLIDLANRLSYLSFADELDIDELMTQASYIKFDLHKARLTASQVRKMHQDVKDLIIGKF